jgi:tetratricopeptide (TPR) repeat protein
MNYFTFKTVEYNFIMNNDFAETIATCDAIIARTSHNLDLADAYLYRGSAQLQLGNMALAYTDLDEAAKRYHAADSVREQAVKLNHIHAYTNLGILAYLEWEASWTNLTSLWGNKLSQAINYFSKAIDIAERKLQGIYPLPYLHRSRAYAKNNDSENSIADLNFASHSLLFNSEGKSHHLKQELQRVVRILLTSFPWEICRFALSPDCSCLLKDVIRETLYAGIHGQIRVPTFPADTETQQKKICEFIISLLQNEKSRDQQIDLEDIVQFAVKHNLSLEYIEDAIRDKQKDIQENINNLILYQVNNNPHFNGIKTLIEDYVKKDSEKIGITLATTYAVVHQQLTDLTAGATTAAVPDMILFGSQKTQPAVMHSLNVFPDILTRKPNEPDSTIDTSVISSGTRLFL